MPIGVYRIFLSETWRDDPARARLLTGLDALPGFLCRIDSVPAGADPATGETVDGAIRIAMTQSHVALVNADRIDAHHAHALREIMLARAGFRRRIPVLAVVGSETQRPRAALPVDLVVGSDPAAVACAIQELAETAARDWRRMTDGEPAPVQALAAAVPSAAALPGGTARPLPIAEIAAALDELRRGRQE